MKRISIVGLGYIGLPTAIMAAEANYSVFGFDKDQNKIEKINSGNPSIFEPEICQRLAKVFENKSLYVSSSLQYADCFIIAVPTPLNAKHLVDLTFVFDSAEKIAKRLMPGNLVILESTVPVGTTKKLSKYLEELSSLKLGKDFFVAHCPERVLPGQIFKELIENDRVIGGICQKSCELASCFYSKFITGALNVCDDKTAEIVKLIENSSRDVQLAFSNQVASVCKVAKIDPYRVIELANKHPRVNILNPGCGVGGHCIAVDPWFLINSFPMSTKLLKMARKVNDEKPHAVIKEVLDKVEEMKTLGLKNPKVLSLGLSFKPDVDDIRESPAIKIAIELKKRLGDLEFVACDPHVCKSKISELNIPLALNLHEAINFADIILISVKHKIFTLMEESLFCGKVVLDACGLLYDMRKQQSKSFFRGGMKTDYEMKYDGF
jgi:UDP-N-acetyl-D-mannosaminuronic acid dehydrogenase